MEEITRICYTYKFDYFIGHNPRIKSVQFV